MSIRIIVRLQFEGFHNWPEAAEKSTEPYLAAPHRHIFHVEAVYSVLHSNRDVEFISFKRDLEEYCNNHFRGPHSWSCEHMATMLCEHFNLRSCRVFEDNENGAEVSFDA